MGSDREKLLAGVAKDRGLDDELAKQLLDEYQVAPPGKRTLIDQQPLKGLPEGGSSRSVVGRRTLLDQQSQPPAPVQQVSIMCPAVLPSLGPRSSFDDFRSRGLHEVLAALTSMRCGHSLMEATMSAAPRDRRPPLPSLTGRPAPPDPAGQAMWRAAERRAV